jgi:hypothetical protein
VASVSTRPAGFAISGGPAACDAESGRVRAVLVTTKLIGWARGDLASLARPSDHTHSTPSPGGCSGQRACTRAQLGISETAHGPTLEYRQLLHSSSTHITHGWQGARRLQGWCWLARRCGARREWGRRRGGEERRRECWRRAWPPPTRTQRGSETPQPWRHCCTRSSRSGSARCSTTSW